MFGPNDLCTLRYTRRFPNACQEANIVLTLGAMKQHFYISTAIPYVNARPHIGFAEELILADVVARWRRLKGDYVFFVTGTDDNALKNLQAAEAVGKETAEFVNEHAEVFRDLTNRLTISNTDFIRTREERHSKGAQQLWSRCNPDDIYKKNYVGLYCVGCEAFYSEHELPDRICPEHKRPLEEIREENYFFRLSRYQQQLEELIVSDTVKIIPEKRKNEILSFIRSGLEDFSISRSQARARGWGVPVPGDPEQIMYVWFDALSNYINAVGYASDEEKFKVWWQETDGEIAHLIGKGVIRFHAVYWLAMLLSAGIRLPHKIIVHDYITVGGEKMSKSIGNVVDPFTLIERYGADAVHAFFVGAVPTFEDGDYTEERFRAWYSSELANGIGNLTARVLTLAEKYGVAQSEESDALGVAARWQELAAALDQYQLDRAYKVVQGLVQALDQTMEKTKPWQKALSAEERQKIMGNLVEGLRHVAWMIAVIMPATSEKILEQLFSNAEERAVEKEKSYNEKITWGGISSGQQVKRGEVLFPRLEK